jgi:hypothetical protein
MVSDNIFDFLLAHRTLGVVTAGVCAFVSLSLIARLWVLHQRARVIPKIVWSVVLLIPLFGWLCFAAFYTPPEALSWTGHVEHGRDAGSIGDGHL